ncbi:hypothetical protein GGF42_003488 [Coemansia sp. RSA 2424]|nr:hypothetical protein GGF42_003488 [Coemansia sp. RSA 2424]
MNVYNNNNDRAESVVESEFSSGPQPSRYVPKPSSDAGDNRMAATPSLYSAENVARSTQQQQQQQQQQQPAIHVVGPSPQQSYASAGPQQQQAYQNSGYASGPATIARPSPNASFASNGGGGMSMGPQPQTQQTHLQYHPTSAMLSNASIMPASGMGLSQGTIAYGGPVAAPLPHGHGHHYAHAGGSAEGAYYAPSSGTPSHASIPQVRAGGGGGNSSAQYSDTGGIPAAYNAQPPPRAQTSFSASSYAPPSTYAATAGPQLQQPSYAAPGSAYGGTSYGGPAPPPPRQQPMARENSPPSSRVNTAGKIALGALAAGAVAYGVHEFVEQHEEDEERRRLAIAAARRQQEDAERQRRENDARRRREDEGERRREDHDRWRRDEDERHRQDAVYGQQQSRPASTLAYGQQQPGSVYVGGGGYAGGGGRPRADSISSHNSRASDPSAGSGFRPPAPFGRPPYSFMQDDVRFVDPSRSSHASATPETYPELRQPPSDTVIKIGTVLALKHLATGRLLRSDRSHSTASGSNQQLVYASRRNPADDDWWQVLPANQDVPVPGSIVSYGTQIRLRHINSGRHLHSHYAFVEGRSGQNEATAYGDQTLSDENDHWVVERWGDGGYSHTWRATDCVVLRHYVSGMALHSHDIMLRDDVQSVTCHGPGSDENDKWKVVLAD